MDFGFGEATSWSKTNKVALASIYSAITLINFQLAIPYHSAPMSRKSKVFVVGVYSKYIKMYSKKISFRH